MINSKNINTLFAIAFIFSGLLGFVPNPFVAPDGVFAVNIWHNLVHVVTGIVFAFGAFMGNAVGTQVVRGVSFFYIVVTILGFLMSGDMLLGFIHVNQADKWLHFSLAVVITFAGFVLLRGSENEPVHAER